MPRFGLPIEDLEDDEGVIMVPCPTCRGKGKLFDPNDPDDWKALEKSGKESTCPTCQGNCQVPGN